MKFRQLYSICLLLVVLKAAEEREGKTGFLDQTKWPALAGLTATMLFFLHNVTTSFRTPVSWFNHSRHLDFYSWTKNRCYVRPISLALYFPGNNGPAVLWKMMGFCFFGVFWRTTKPVQKPNPNQNQPNKQKKSTEKILCFMYREFRYSKL